MILGGRRKLARNALYGQGQGGKYRHPAWPVDSYSTACFREHTGLLPCSVCLYTLPLCAKHRTA